MAKRQLALQQQGQTTLQLRIQQQHDENEAALKAAIAAVCSGRDCACLLTGACAELRPALLGPVDPHNPDSLPPYSWEQGGELPDVHSHN